MNFQDLPVIESPQALLDHALKVASKRATEFKRKLRKGEVVERQAKAEQERLKKIVEALNKSLLRIPGSFPSFDGLPEFYVHLVATTLDVVRVKQSLAAVSSAIATIRTLANDYSRKYRGVEQQARVLAIRREAIGRMSSVLKRLAKDLKVLEKARTIMRTYPDLKHDLFTVAIAGFPNAGKSTLLNKLTGSKAEVDAYAFTTKTLNTGSFEHRHNKIQCVDTPGTLARPEKMNPIEQQAFLAMKYASHVIVYIYDLTEHYPLKDQERLEKELKNYGKDLLIYVSKTDVLDKKVVAAFTGRKDCIVDVDELKQKITELFEQDFL